MYVPAKVWTVCTDLPPGQGNRWPIVSHWQLTERPTNRFWTEITANFVQKCPIFGRGDLEGLVIEIEEHGGGESTWFDGEVKSGGKGRSGEGVLKIFGNLFSEKGYLSTFTFFQVKEHWAEFEPLMAVELEKQTVNREFEHKVGNTFDGHNCIFCASF